MAEQDTSPAYSHAQRLRHQLPDTTVVERATGVVMHQTGATADAARAQLARDAARTGRTLPRHCARVLAEVTGTSARAGTAVTGPPIRHHLVTSDPEHALHELTAAYRTPIRMTAPEPGTVFHLEHTDAHLFQVGENRLPGKLSFTSAPAPQVVVTRLIAGTMDLPTPAGEERHAVGDITLIGPAATVHLTTTDAHTRTTTLPLPLLHKVAGQLPGQNHPLRFTHPRPASQALAEHWRATRVYVNSLLDHPDLGTAAPLLVANTAHLLAATVLAVFPNTVTAAPDTPVDHTDASPGTVRRAAAFINDHAHRDITLADIAAGAYVTPRALQYAFRNHLDTTPLAYLRDVRLRRAHRDLIDADPALETVTRIAARWGFLHPTRFADHYERLYRCPPSTTLHA
ncbi:helix-turn-helix domain-containing protein [Kitasatospora acidiphila]|uniref:helix-turn-helix domain-containing protein n=1 Tax=Kitasatospora acidiphila TaxID=2567942 RepID=UPI003C730DDE